MLIATLAFGLVHCSKDSGGNSDDGDITVIDLPIQIKQDAKLEPAQKEVAEAVKEKKGVSFRKVTQLMIEKHVKAQKNSSVSTSTIQAFVGSISPSKSLSPAQTKIHFEDQISKKHGGKALIYNAAKNNIVDIYSENRVQCYSGTYMYELVRRQQKPSSFRAGNEVVVFTEGHVQPGYMIKKDKGYALIAIETTVKGGGRTYYGSAENLSAGVIVVDAELFALTEVFADEISNPAEVARAAIKVTAKKYGIPVKDLDLSPVNDATTAAGKRELNQSIFAYGNPDLSPVDKEREDSGDDGKLNDEVYFQGMSARSAYEMPAIISLLKANNCKNMDGQYTSKDAEIYVRTVGCKQLKILNSSSGLTSNTYDIDRISVTANTEVALQLRITQLGRYKKGDYVYNSESLLYYDLAQKKILWNNKVYTLSKETAVDVDPSDSKSDAYDTSTPKPVGPTLR